MQRGWCAAAPLAGLPVEVAACLATPAGVRYLHQLAVVMHVIITLWAGVGVRLVCEFMELSGLSAGPLTAASMRLRCRCRRRWPNIFHGQHEVFKGTSLNLDRQVRQANAAVVGTQMLVDAARAAQRAYDAQVPHPRGRPLAFAARIDAALTERVAAEAEQILARQTQAGEQIRELGRNGHLSLYHYGSHRLNGRKLAALTAIHNFYVRRPDGTTAAERFFGRAHPALFDQVLAYVDLSPPARRRRPRPVSLPTLTLVAA